MAKSKRHYGIYFDDFIAGAVCYGQSDGWTHRTVLKYGVAVDKTWVLSRGACVHWAHEHSASKLIGLSLKMLKKSTDAHIVLAYSDSEAGEIGTVYQASNWLHLGIADKSHKGFISPDGKRWHRNVIYDLRRAEGSLKTKTWEQKEMELLDLGWTTYKILGKRRYVFPFNQKLRNLIAKSASPYPKRDA